MEIYLKKLELEEPIGIFNLYKEMVDEKWVQPLDMTLENFSELLKENYDKNLDVNLKKEEVRETVYWLYAGRTPCGAAFIRHGLNESLINEGQIAYYIKKSERGRGYGSKILSLCLDIFRDKGGKRVLITCNTYNSRSERIIIKNKGVLENVVDKVNRYWISL